MEEPVTYNYTAIWEVNDFYNPYLWNSTEASVWVAHQNAIRLLKTLYR